MKKINRFLNDWGRCTIYVIFTYPAAFLFSELMIKRAPVRMEFGIVLTIGQICQSRRGPACAITNSRGTNSNFEKYLCNIVIDI